LAATTGSATPTAIVGDTTVKDDPRQVRYWTTMCLPNPWAAPPADAKPTEIYIYRPDFYQDQEGIERRIGLWLDPSTRTAMKLHLADVFGAPAAKGATRAASGPASPAVPVKSDTAFRNEFDEAYPAKSAVKADSSSTNSTPAQPAPSGAATAP
jgi:hypothetical protein